MKLKLATALFATIAIATPAFAEAGGPAFVAPDSNSLKAGYFRQLFQPTQFDIPPMSYELHRSMAPKGLNNFSAQLPPCDGKESACIKSVEYQVGGGAWENATPGPDEGQRLVVDGELIGPNQWKKNLTSTFSENLTLHRPTGSTARVWNAADAKHLGGTGYLVSAAFSGLRVGSAKYSLDDFNLAILPVNRVENISESDCAAPGVFHPTTPDEDGPRTGFCSNYFDFPSDLKFRITLSLGAFISDISGWFDGRLTTPLLQVNSKLRTLAVTGGAVNVPTVGTIPTAYEKIPASWPQGHQKEIQQEQTSGNIGWSSSMSSNESDSVNQFNQFGNGIDPKALGENSIWKLSSIHGDSRCVQKGVVNGVLSTNAPIYSPQPPTWLPKDQSLNFQVASSHLDSGGNVFHGNYSLLVSEKTAACLWGSNFSRGSATVSVTNASGVSEIATTSFGVQNGWAAFNAAGFTFSSPKIKVRIISKKK